MPQDDAFARIKDLVMRAREVPQANRAAFLAEASGGDDAVVREVEALLAHDVSVELLQTGVVLARAGADLGAPEPGNAPPARVGPYRITGVLGEGGMGIVYRADQDEPIRRTVALKLVRRGMDTARIVQRFELERQTLARMNHAGIARVFDAGATEDGRPFFVMELVDGRPITEFAQERRLPLAARLDLFVTVCDAVTHAHQKGVIHRDLKPSNVLVAEEDGRALPKIIDFGIAKAIGDDGDGLTLGARGIGTPAYMSPEQAGVSEVPVDTRSDVYALGVLLYELLTGHSPYQIDTGTPAEFQRAFYRTSPVLPSASTPPAPLRSTDLAGDLDSVVLKAIEVDADRRYATVAQLAEDLDRYRRGLPVSARAATWSYRTAKFVRRNRLAVGAAAAVLAALAGALIVSLVSLQRVSAERDAARAARDAAQAARDTAASTTEFLGTMLTSVSPLDRGGGSTVDVRMRDVLDDALTRLDGGAIKDATAEARLRQSLARSYRALGALDVACAQFARGVERAAEVEGPAGPTALAVGSEQITCLLQAGRRDEAKEKAARLAEACGDPLPPAAPAEQCAMVLYSRGAVEFDTRRFDAAIVTLRRALAVHPAPDSDRMRLNIERVLSQALSEAGHHEEAVAMSRSVIARQEQALGKDHFLVVSSLQGLGILMQNMGRPEEALAIYQDVVARSTRALGANNEVTLRSRHQLGQALCELGRFEECRDVVAAVLEERVRLSGRGHPSSLLAAHTLSRARLALGDVEGGLEGLREVVRLAERALPAGSLTTDFYAVVLGEHLGRQKRYREAEAVARKVYERTAPNQESRARELAQRAASVLATVSEAQGRKDDAAEWRQRAEAGKSAS
ncbi:MAG: serine/threonine-protein kinase [Vicinamibacterales bacterium]